MTGSGYRLPDGTVPVLVSAVTAGLVAAEAAGLRSYLTAHPDVDPQAVAAMLFRTRIAHPHRALATVTSRGELLDALAAIIDDRDHPAVLRAGTAAAPRRVAFVFPGQGGQRPGMGRIFYDAVPAYRAEVDRCTEAFRVEAGTSPLDYLLDAQPAAETASSVQPALFTQMAGLAAMWRSFGIEPHATVGHSQGEIAAAYLSGVISLADATRVIGVRAAAADEFDAVDYAMAVVAADTDTCSGLLARCSGFAELSVVNSPGMTGISGERAAVQGIVDELTERGVFARVIGVHYPAHTSAIDTLLERFAAAAPCQPFRETDLPCIGATYAGPITADLPVTEYWFDNLRNTVRFDRAITAAVELGIDTFIELADHPTLQSAIAQNDRDALVIGTSERSDTGLGVFTRNLALLMINDLDYRWESLRTGVAGPSPLPLADFPNTVMNEVPLWLPYISGAAGSQPGPEPEPAAGTAQLLVEQWVRLSRRAMLPPRRIRVIDHTGACAELAAELAAAGVTVADSCDTYVILMPASPQLDDTAAAAAVSAYLADPARWPAFTDAITDCWLVTVGGEAVIAADAAPDLVHAGISAAFRSIGAEHPGLRFGHLDLPAGAPPAAARIVSALHTRDETELALRDNGVYAKRVVTGEAPATDTGTPEHVLIVGGTGNLGLEFCEHFAQAGARRITLVSRSGETPDVAERLRRIDSAPVTVTSCDVTDAAAVANLAMQHRDTPADLIIHAALGYVDAELADITAQQADQVLRSKIVGISHVLQDFPRSDDCRVVLCSSVAATIGGRGQIVYAAANRMLDAMAVRLRAEGMDCVAVQWGQWTVHFDLDPTGWAKLAATGLLPMRPADAIAVGLAPLRGNAVVAGFDLARAQPLLAGYGYGPLLSELTPAVEAPPPIDTADLPQHLLRLLASAIGVDRPDAIDTETPMVAIGLDSLQALEFSRRVKAELDYDLDVARLLSGASLADVLAQLSP